MRQIRGAKELAEIVLSHHECPDESGYPRGLLGDRISVEAHILRATDVFAALVEPRSYKPAMSSGEALQRMQQLAGKLDPVALHALEQVVAAGDIAPQALDETHDRRPGVVAPDAPR